MKISHSSTTSFHFLIFLTSFIFVRNPNRRFLSIFFFIPVSGLVSKSTREMAQEGESARKGYEFHACGAEW